LLSTDLGILTDAVLAHGHLLFPAFGILCCLRHFLRGRVHQILSALSQNALERILNRNYGSWFEMYGLVSRVGVTSSCLGTLPLSSEYGTCETVKARFWPLLRCGIPLNTFSCSLFAHMQCVVAWQRSFGVLLGSGVKVPSDSGFTL
jgi:hypothetical protein